MAGVGVSLAKPCTPIWPTAITYAPSTGIAPDVEEPSVAVTVCAVVERFSNTTVCPTDTETFVARSQRR